MKLIAIVLISAMLVLANARTYIQQESETIAEQRFWGSVTNWVNQNIVKPIEQVVTSGVNTVTNAFNSIADPVAALFNSASASLVDTINQAINWVKETSVSVYNMASSIFYPSSGNQVQVTDPCQSTCFQRINYNGAINDYYFDKPNGCISKGFVDPSLKEYDSCCDEHNACLNSKCCTNNCQLDKNDCDTKYDTCLKSKCVLYISDNTKFYTCLAKAAAIAQYAVNRTCNAAITTNRKICYC
jgi:hypothetical protein